jgi:hypothetical protein
MITIMLKGKQGNRGNGEKEGVLGMIFILDLGHFRLFFKSFLFPRFPVSPVSHFSSMC